MPQSFTTFSIDCLPTTTIFAICISPTFMIYLNPYGMQLHTQFDFRFSFLLLAAFHI